MHGQHTGNSSQGVNGGLKTEYRNDVENPLITLILRTSSSQSVCHRLGETVSTRPQPILLADSNMQGSDRQLCRCWNAARTQ